METLTSNPKCTLSANHSNNRDRELTSRIAQLRDLMHSLRSSIEKERQLIEWEVNFQKRISPESYTVGTYVGAHNAWFQDWNRILEGLEAF